MTPRDRDAASRSERSAGGRRRRRRRKVGDESVSELSESFSTVSESGRRRRRKRVPGTGGSKQTRRTSTTRDVKGGSVRFTVLQSSFISWLLIFLIYADHTNTKETLCIDCRQHCGHAGRQTITTHGNC